MMTTYEKDTGLDISEADQIEYNTWVANEVHAAGMFVGLKNAVEMVKKVVDYFDFALNESCHIYNMCTVRSYEAYSCCCFVVAIF